MLTQNESKHQINTHFPYVSQFHWHLDNFVINHHLYKYCGRASHHLKLWQTNTVMTKITSRQEKLNFKKCTVRWFSVTAVMYLDSGGHLAQTNTQINEIIYDVSLMGCIWMGFWTCWRVTFEHANMVHFNTAQCSLANDLHGWSLEMALLAMLVLLK